MITPSLTIIIASWNGWSRLRTCLASIYGGRLPAAIGVLVVDNASQDGTQQKISLEFPQVRLHQNAANLGHTAAINQGFALADSDYIFVLDDDTELGPDCLAKLMEFMETHREVGLVGPRTFNTDGSVQESARNFPGILSGLFGRQSFLTRVFPHNRFASRYLARGFLDATAPFQCAQIGGAAMFLRRSVLATVGPWDKRYAGYWVDTDWCQTMRQKGEKIYCVPAARLAHHESNARGKRKDARRVWIFHHGAYQYYSKWHTWGWWDPRSIVAGGLLSMRAGGQIVVNRLRSIEPRDVPMRLHREPIKPQLRGNER